MWVLKKIVTFLLISVLCFGPLFQAHANGNINKNLAVKEILLTKNSLKKMRNWTKYINAMDQLSEQLKNNPERLEKTSKKVKKALEQLYIKSTLSSKEMLIINILSYLDARITFIQLDNSQKKIEAQDEAINKILEAVKNPSISISDKEKLENAVMIIQKNLLDKTQQNVNNILWEFNSYFNYENTGNFEMDLNIDHESIWTIEAEIKLSDYVSQNVNFDSRFTGNLSAMIDANKTWEDSVRLELKSFIDFIIKDWNYYTLVKNLDIISEENLDDLEEFIDILKKIAAEKKYIKFSIPENEQMMNLIKSIHPDYFFKDMENLFSQPMFTAYKKEWIKYSIIPTKYACDSLKVLANKFDLFNPDSCSDGQYENFIKDMLSFWELTITLGDENILAFTAYQRDDLEIFNASIWFTDDEITKINLNIIPDQEKYPDEMITIFYEKNKTLNILYHLDEGDTDIVFNSSLDRRNNFSKITTTAYIKDFSDTIEWSLSLQNKTIAGELSLQSSRWNYNYETWEYEITPWDGFFSKINGTTNTKNELKTLDITFNGQEAWEEFINWVFKYNFPKILFSANISNSYARWNIAFDGTWNKTNKNFDQLNAYIEVNNKERIYNEDTFRFETTWEENKVFHLDYSLQSKIINGEINILNNDWEFLFWIDSQWKYEKNKLSLINKIEINSLYVSDLIEEPSDENPIINFNFGYDYTFDNANADIFIDMILEGKTVLEFMMKNTGTIEYKKVDINTPSNTIEYQEVFWSDIY